jgi:hypothetical protein
MLFDAEDMTNFQRLMFVDMPVNESYTPNYEPVETVGRVVPLRGYKSTDISPYTISVHFFADVSPMLQVDRKVKWFKTFCLSRDTDVATVAPKKVILAIGAFVLVKGVITSLNVSYREPIGGITTKVGALAMFPHYATVEFSVTPTENLFTGGQFTYEQAMDEMNYGMGASNGQPTVLGKALNLL